MATRSVTKRARAAVAAIIEDMSDRRGFRQNWDAIDDDIKAEIRAAWVASIVLEFGDLKVEA